MKKLLVVFAVAVSLAACNNAADSTADAKDSIDSVANEKIEAVDSTAEQKMDQIDSTAEQAKDSLNKIDSAVKN